jgi:hypothetical protein
MPRHADEFEEEDEWDDDEGDELDDDDDSTIPCPHCRHPVYEDAERCPHCERYLSAEDAPLGRKPLWIVIGVIAALAVVYIWIMRNQ